MSKQKSAKAKEPSKDKTKEMKVKQEIQTTAEDDQKDTIQVAKSVPIEDVTDVEPKNGKPETEPDVASIGSASREKLQGTEAPQGDEDDDQVLNELLGLDEDSDDEDSADTKEAEGPKTVEEGFVAIFKPECLECAHLVAFKKKKQRDCHYSKGNKDCPAQSVKIVVRVPLEQIVPQWLTAEETGDFEKIAKMSALLATKPDWYRDRVNSALRESRLKRAKRS